MWKCRRKYRLLWFLLPAQLRDMVPALRAAIALMAWAMRRLQGNMHDPSTRTLTLTLTPPHTHKVHSYDAAVAMGILPGSRSLRRSEIDGMGADLLRALVLLAGSIIITHLVPIWHHFVHYGEYTKTHGFLRLFWMMCFERYKLYIKQLVRDVHRPEKNLVRTTAQDVAAHYVDLTQTELRELSGQQCHECILSFPEHIIAKSSKLNDMRFYCDSDVSDHYSVCGYRVAHILNVHFRAGEWPKHPRCGSVITCVIGGRSLYARVNRFLQVFGEDVPGYASVSWFSEPQYLYPYPNPLGVRCCREDGSLIRSQVGCVVKITQIDPAQIMVEHEVETNSYIMIRDAGYNTRPRRPTNCIP